MAFNGSGTFNRIFSWVADKNAGLNISSSRMDTDTNDMASNGFGNCLTRDGQGQATANLPMLTFRHTGVGAAAARTDYARLDQVQDAITINWTTAGGTADAITATYTPALTALVDGQFCFVRALGANTITTPTFAPNGLTARTITKVGGVALVPGDIVGNLHELVLRYNLTNTRWELINPAVVSANGVVTASITNAAVTYAKIQNVTNNRLLGNRSGGPAAPEEISLGAGLAFSGTTLKLSTTTPSYQIFTSGIGATYTTPAGATWLKVRVWGGGGGGGGSSTGATGVTGTTGNTSTFNSITALGGNPGTGNVTATPGVAGTGGGPGAGGTATTIFRQKGSDAGGGNAAVTGSPGGIGGNSPMLGGGGTGGLGGATGGAGQTNSGGGGGGGGGTSVYGPSGGGGAGEYYELIITAPAATYTYTVGATAAGGVGATTTGGAGAAGRIVVEEYYN